MDLMDLAQWNASRSNVDASGAGAKIPWDEPDFSRRMLEQHLNQEHDWASRRGPIIAAHAAWIAEQLSVPSRILDMGCGPGLYTQALAERGHQCVGVDFSPASIEYARQRSADCDPKPEYILGDIRNYRSNQKFDCIIMTFGEFNAFIRKDAALLLEHCAEMLPENGLFILEAHTYDAVRAMGEAPATWQRHATGLFSAGPHSVCGKTAGTLPKKARFRAISLLTQPTQQYGNTLLSCRPTDLKAIRKCSRRLPCPYSGFSAKTSGIPDRISIISCKHSSAGKSEPAYPQQ